MDGLSLAYLLAPRRDDLNEHFGMYEGSILLDSRWLERDRTAASVVGIWPAVEPIWTYLDLFAFGTAHDTLVVKDFAPQTVIVGTLISFVFLRHVTVLVESD